METNAVFFSSEIHTEYENILHGKMYCSVMFEPVVHKFTSGI